jgi:hypothetical protein
MKDVDRVRRVGSVATVASEIPDEVPKKKLSLCMIG